MDGLVKMSYIYNKEIHTQQVGIEVNKMGKKQEVKYRVIPETLMKDVVEFIDEMQFEASKLDSTENHHLLNLCNYLISCLINSDSFNDDFDKDKDEDDEGDFNPEEYGYEIPDEAFDWESSSTDYREYDFGDMSEEEYERMMEDAEKLFNGYRDKYKGKTKRINKPGMTLEQFKKELIKDIDLSPEEKFELYYHEHNLRNNKVNKVKKISFDSMLKKLGLKKNKK